METNEATGTKQISFHMPTDESIEFAHHVKRMGATKSGVLRSLLCDWMAWRRSVQASELAEKQKAILQADWVQCRYCSVGRVDPREISDGCMAMCVRCLDSRMDNQA